MAHTGFCLSPAAESSKGHLAHCPLKPGRLTGESHCEATCSSHECPGRVPWQLCWRGTAVGWGQAFMVKVAWQGVLYVATSQKRRKCVSSFDFQVFGSFWNLLSVRYNLAVLLLSAHKCLPVKETKVSSKVPTSTQESCSLSQTQCSLPLGGALPLAAQNRREFDCTRGGNPSKFIN